MMKHRYLIGALICSFVSTGLVLGMSCNERMRHGPKGLAKGSLALLCAAATVYTAADLHETSSPLWTDWVGITDEKKRQAFRDSSFEACALAALAYVTWSIGTSSLESLATFLLDDEESLKMVKEVAAGQEG